MDTQCPTESPPWGAPVLFFNTTVLVPRALARVTNTSGAKGQNTLSNKCQALIGTVHAHSCAREKFY
jgi:hypothetical protein